MNKFSIIQRSTQFVNKQQIGDVLMIDSNANVFVTFNSTSKFIWEKINEPISFGDLVDFLCDMFKISTSVCVPQVLLLIEEFEKNKMIEIS